MHSPHELELIEVVGSPGWRAIRRELKQWLNSKYGVLTAPARSEWDFIDKEVKLRLYNEIESFFNGIEQTAEKLHMQDANA